MGRATERTTKLQGCSGSYLTQGKLAGTPANATRPWRVPISIVEWRVYLRWEAVNNCVAHTNGASFFRSGLVNWIASSLCPPREETHVWERRFPEYLFPHKVTILNITIIISSFNLMHPIPLASPLNLPVIPAEATTTRRSLIQRSADVQKTWPS